MSVAGIVAVSWLLLTNDMVREVPFQTTKELLLKFLPLTVRTKPAPPAVALLGEIEVIDGVDGHEQEITGSPKSNSRLDRSAFFLAVIVTIRVSCLGRAIGFLQ
jgi:hypothetical protein